MVDVAGRVDDQRGLARPQGTAAIAVEVEAALGVLHPEARVEGGVQRVQRGAGDRRHGGEGLSRARDGRARVQRGAEQLGVHPRHPGDQAGVDGVGPEEGGVHGRDAVDGAADRVPLALARRRRGHERGDGRRRGQVGRAGGHRDGGAWRPAPSGWRRAAGLPPLGGAFHVYQVFSAQVTIPPPPWLRTHSVSRLPTGRPEGRIGGGGAQRRPDRREQDQDHEQDRRLRVAARRSSSARGASACAGRGAHGGTACPGRGRERGRGPGGRCRRGVESTEGRPWPVGGGVVLVEDDLWGHGAPGSASCVVDGAYGGRRHAHGPCRCVRGCPVSHGPGPRGGHPVATGEHPGQGRTTGRRPTHAGARRGRWTGVDDGQAPLHRRERS